ncbi:hypothetical protein HMPREF9554_01978 [Treponema phagedenis F0421]|nr:hypothetical protein HMPREF9554_01978 [Treponema phagedenis F0421]
MQNRLALKHRCCLEPTCFKTSLLRGTTGVRARSDFNNGGQTYHSDAESTSYYYPCSD